jgi:hypothetical protein
MSKGGAMNVSINSRITTEIWRMAAGGYMGRGCHYELEEQCIHDRKKQAPVTGAQILLAVTSAMLLEEKASSIDPLIKAVNIRFRPIGSQQEGHGPIMEVVVVLASPFQDEELEIQGCHSHVSGLGQLKPGFDTASLSAQQVSDDLVRNVKEFLAKKLVEIRTSSARSHAHLRKVRIAINELKSNGAGDGKAKKPLPPPLEP